MKNLMPSISLVVLALLANTALAAEQTSPGMMQECGMMGGGFMLAGVALLVLLFVALILAILALAKYLFFSKTSTGDRS